MEKRKFTIGLERGVHARTAAMITGEASRIDRKCQTKLYIEKSEVKVPLTSMLAVTALDIKHNDEVSIYASGRDEITAIDQMEALLKGSIVISDEEAEWLDRVLDENAIASDKILEALYNAVFYLNRDQVIVLVNSAAEKLTGFKDRELIGRAPYDIWGENELSEVLMSEEPIKEKRIKIGDHIGLIDFSNVYSEENHLIGKLGIFKDITKIEALRTELEFTADIKDRFGSILNHISDGICFVNREGDVLYVNPSYEKIWKVNKTEVIDKNIKTLLPNSPSVKVLSTQKKVFDLVIHQKDGRKILSSATPVRINEDFVGVLSSYKEVTEFEHIRNLLEQTEKQLEYLKTELNEKNTIDSAFKGIIGDSQSLKDCLKIASKVSKTKASIMILGESGTGKELIARAIHDMSPRSKSRMVKVNCGAIPENLLESELFGYEKGSFTGANQLKKGKFELADGGTLFLDEIGEIPLNLQVKLLRVLQEGEIDRIGGNFPIKIDVRIIAATNRDLEEMVRQELFREDLYYRLNVIPIEVPSLRERKEDLLLLVEFFLKKIAESENMEYKKISVEALECFENYEWPGNIRELENVLTRAVMLSDDYLIKPKYLPKHISMMREKLDYGLVNLKQGKLAKMEEYDKAIIKMALELHKSFNKAGKALGLTHRTISLKAKKYGLLDSDKKYQ
ncbi:MAG: HPr family phosphocarrier protein [Tissierellales bacterium]|jgi:phosphotransferase system HPr (HPr) family protein|nr:HPr family phosphocarrier protein [Tissierellales bacterium]